MQFAQPLWLIAGAAVCALLVWQYRRFDRAQRAALAQFAAERLLPNLISSVSARRRRVKRTLYTVGVALLFVALARPQVGFEWQETHRKGLELLFAVDTSKSMLAQDVKPDRLTRAKLAVTDLVAQLKGDGVGIVAFAGSAFLQCPVTLDYDAFRESLDALDTRTIPHGGSDIAAAIRESEAVFETRTSKEKILVLITDGEDLGGEGIAAAEKAAKDGVKIFTVGVGDVTGELVPVPSENGGTDFARDENGELVRSQLDEKALRKIAEVTGGIYQPLGAQGEGLATIYEQGLADFTRQDLSSRQAKVPLERFHWVLLAALACFIGDLLLGNRRRIRGSKIAPALRRATVALVLLAGVVGAQAATPQSAEEAYRNGEFAKSQEEYAATAAEDPTKAELHFNTGSAAYKVGDYAQAAAGFQKSLGTEDVPVQQRAYYNLGNTQYRLGQQTQAENPQETIKTWEEAVKSYDAALQITPEDAEAKHNRDLVQRKIDELKQQEEQKKQDQQDQQDKSEDQKSDSENSEDEGEDQQSNDQKSGSEDSKSDSQDSEGGGEEQEQDSQEDSQEGSEEPKDEGEDQQSDSKDSKGGDQEQNSHDGSEEPKDDAKDDKDGSGDSKDENENENENEDPKEEPESGEGDKESETDSGDEGEDEAENQQSPHSGEGQEDQQQADAESDQGEQPNPVNPGEKPSQGRAEAANGEESPEEDAAGAAAAQEPREAGQMTTEEAMQLLDALKGDERKVPAISAQGRAAAGVPNQHAILKDW